MATRVTFITVPVELQALAHSCHRFLKDVGFSPKTEFAKHDFPEEATLYARGGGKEHFYLVESRIKQERVTLWAAFGRSRDGAAFVSICVPAATPMKAAVLTWLRGQGVGLYTIDSAGALVEVVEPIDLSLSISLPPLNQQKSSARKQLLSVYDAFRNGRWKRGFEDACKVVESCARKRLCNEARAGMVEVPGKGGTIRKLGVQEIKKKTLGGLADVFCRKLKPTHIDSLLCSGLKVINPDRIDVAHNTLSTAREKKLRRKVGQHMWTIHNMMRAMSK